MTTAKKAAWHTAEIDKYLLLLAKEVSDSLKNHWPELVVLAERQEALSSDAATAWPAILRSDPASVAAALLSEDKRGIGQTLRRMLPFYGVVSRERRETLLRDAALSGSCAELYRERWEGEPPAGAFVDAIPQFLIAAMKGPLLDSFSEFVGTSGRTKWLISADFCIGDKNRHNDVFAFTIFPYDAAFDVLAAEIKAVFAADLKATKVVTDDMVAYLRSRRRFHFAFMVNRDRKVVKDVAEARVGMDRTISSMLAWHDAQDHTDVIAAAKALRQEANANTFNFRLFGDMVLMAALAGSLALLLEMEGRAELIGLFPDRDDMTTAYRGTAYAMFHLNQSAFAGRFRVPESKIAFAMPGPRDDGRKGLYYDEFVRIPDYIGGAAAGIDLNKSPLQGIAKKCLDIVGNAFIDNDNVAIIQLDVPPKGLKASRVVISSTPPSRSSADCGHSDTLDEGADNQTCDADD